jgi:hypothetical protein
MTLAKAQLGRPDGTLEMTIVRTTAMGSCREEAQLQTQHGQVGIHSPGAEWASVDGKPLTAG